ncbi:hypothetical protein C942_02463 [Photobacterium marinum]|uniref:Uncharacterized protein n=1 Tax=Photobacterium marinum TaxID=1056511 RepID=L8JA58_9GAMM|nr:hypothetical protein C942_02463 [Photobacterium marinum]
MPIVKFLDKIVPVMKLARNGMKLRQILAVRAITVCMESFC